MTHKNEDTEQWQLQGDCSKCRRAKYCTKDCAAHKRRMKFEIELAMFGGFINVMGKMGTAEWTAEWKE